MSDLIASIAAQTGIDPETARKGLGAVLTWVKTQISPEHFEKVQAAIPRAPEMIAEAKTTEDDSAPNQGLVGAITGMAGKLFGGKAGADANLLSSLASLGLKPDQIHAFASKVFELLKNHLPPEIVDRIKSALPALATTSAATSD
jgi:uncharacterized protein (DUF2267 family)